MKEGRKLLPRLEAEIVSSKAAKEALQTCTVAALEEALALADRLSDPPYAPTEVEDARALLVTCQGLETSLKKAIDERQEEGLVAALAEVEEAAAEGAAAPGFTSPLGPDATILLDRVRSETYLFRQLQHALNSTERDMLKESVDAARTMKPPFVHETVTAARKLWAQVVDAEKKLEVSLATIFS